MYEAGTLCGKSSPVVVDERCAKNVDAVGHAKWITAATTSEHL